MLYPLSELSIKYDMDIKKSMNFFVILNKNGHVWLPEHRLYAKCSCVPLSKIFTCHHVKWQNTSASYPLASQKYC